MTINNKTLNTNNDILQRSAGFTILEVLVALFIASAFLAPLSFWFYKSKLNQAAYEKYYCTQLLKSSMHKAFLKNKKKKITEQFMLPKKYTIVITATQDGEGTLYAGLIKNSKGFVLSSLIMGRYD
jgi:prepilin-type N-terminal cleavage/methylation domain-containing protein